MTILTPTTLSPSSPLEQTSFGDRLRDLVTPLVLAVAYFSGAEGLAGEGVSGGGKTNGSFSVPVPPGGSNSAVAVGRYKSTPPAVAQPNKVSPVESADKDNFSQYHQRTPIHPRKNENLLGAQPLPKRGAAGGSQKEVDEFHPKREPFKNGKIYKVPPQSIFDRRHREATKNPENIVK